MRDWVALLAFVLSLVNSWAIWFSRRPLHSIGLMERQLSEGETITVEIQNRDNRPITLTKSRCIPKESHNLWALDRSSKSAAFAEINQTLKPQEIVRFYLARTKQGPLLLLIFWRSNAGIAFRKLPLVVFLTKARQDELRKAAGPLS